MVMRSTDRRMVRCPTVRSISETPFGKGVLPSVWLGIVLVAALTGLAPALVSAEEAKAEEETVIERPKLPDRLMLRAGWYYIFGSTLTLTSQTDLGGLGTTIDFNETLGGDTTASNVRIDAQYRFNQGIA